MNVYLRIDINVIAMLLILIIYIIGKKNLDKSDRINAKFFDTTVIVFWGIFCEAATCILNGRPEKWLIPVSILIHICLFTITPIITYRWYLFIHSWVSPNDKVSKTKKILFLLPIIFNFIFVALSPVFKLVFYIDSSNVYHRGVLFLLTMVIDYFYLAYGMLLILKQRNKMIRIEFLPVFVFGILPIMGGIIQASFYGILLAWSSCAFSLIIVYTFLQQRMINIDNLTGVWTRDSFQNYFLKRVKVYKNSNFGLVFIDMDGLKGINDEYGHCEGDIAIQAAAKLIKESVNIGDVVARFGGDEFIIVIDCSTKEELDKKVNRISKAFDDYNKKSEKVYKIDYSVGYDIYTFGYKSIEQFIDHVDSLMYINKRTKKSIAG